jgi:methionyl-tRNA synthetase
MITGTDEHGQKIQRTAEQKGLPPQEHCDQIVGSFQSLWQLLGIDYDRFSRTTAERHQAIVNEFYQRVLQSGDIYLGRQQGRYCVACEEFKEEKDLLEDGKHCAIHINQLVEDRDEENYFFRLSAYQDKLEALYASNPDFIQPASRRNEVLNFVTRGLQDFSISRVNMDWGFPVPNDPKHTIYVWFDALLAYVTALLDPQDEPTLANALKYWWPIQTHIIGKDILRFHAIYWPAMLMSAGLPLPPRVFGHGFLTKDGRKMGKTTGNTLDPVALVSAYGADAVRYYFLKEIEFGADGDYNETRFIDIVNADLGKVLGNLLNRTIGMAKRYCGQVVPTVDPSQFAPDHPLRALGDQLGDKVSAAYEALAFNKACEAAMELARASNGFLEQEAPWTKFKQGDQTSVDAILYAVLESARLVSYLLSPVVPALATRIYQQLGFTVDFEDRSSVGDNLSYNDQSRWGILPTGQVLQDANPVFPVIEQPVA